MYGNNKEDSILKRGNPKHFPNKPFIITPFASIRFLQQISALLPFRKTCWKHPKPFNTFLKIGNAPAELNITQFWKARSKFFGFLRRFPLGSF